MTKIPDLLTRFVDGCYFRQVVREDLLPGAKLLMVPISNERYYKEQPESLGELSHLSHTIRLTEEEPIKEKDGREFLLWNHDHCFAPVADILATEKQYPDPGPWAVTLFLLPKAEFMHLFPEFKAAA